MNTAVTSLPMTHAAPATASTGADLRRQFSRAGAAIWRALEATGRARAHRSLLDLADQYDALQPALAKELRAASRQGPMA
ncbi:MAG: hypothetical protein V4750_11735 [Pseudomonadota bacterium]